MWSVGGVIIRGQRQRRTKDRSSCRRHNCVICDVEAVRKHGTGETERQKAEEQRE